MAVDSGSLLRRQDGQRGRRPTQTGQTANTDRYSPIEKGTICLGRYDGLCDGLRDGLRDGLHDMTAYMT